MIYLLIILSCTASVALTFTSHTVEGFIMLLITFLLVLILGELTFRREVKKSWSRSQR